MKQGVCGGCPAGCSLPGVPAIRDLLEKNDWNGCVDCPHEKDLRMVAQQYRLRKPKWWVVRGRSIIPIWVIERLRRPACEAYEA